MRPLAIALLAVAGCPEEAPSPPGDPAADASVSADASAMATPDAAMIDAGCAETTVELLVNGDFEGDPAAWKQTTSSGDPDPQFIYAPDDDAWVQPHGGTRLVALGNALASGDYLRQRLTLPDGLRSVTVSGWVLVLTFEDRFATVSDVSKVQWSGYDVAVFDNQHNHYWTDWVHFEKKLPIIVPPSYDEVDFRLFGINDAGAITSFYFDDLRVTAVVCQ